VSAARNAVVGLTRKVPFPYRAATPPDGVEPAERDATTGSAYDTAWARRYPARLARLAIVQGVVTPSMRVLASPEILGTDRLEGLRAAGPDGDTINAVFAANHQSHLDTPLLLSCIPEPWRHQLFVGAAADYFFRTRATSALSALAIGAIPIERTKVTRRSADLASRLIDDGWSMLIYPEGGRSPDGWGQAFRGGAAYLSLKCNVPVVPIHLEGTRRILRKGSNIPRPAATRLTFGEPIWPEPDEESRHLGVRIERAVSALADESTTDWWQARQRAHAGATPPLTGPDAPSWRRAWALGDRRRSSARSRRRWPDLR
jgi:1-acyl-sn-glycerol-3-phosphate acyltransferase